MIFYMMLLFTWQQKISYDITACLDTRGHALRAVETVTYCNNSPWTLETLYFHLYANAYEHSMTKFNQESRRMGEYRIPTSGDEGNGYMQIDSIRYEGYQTGYTADESLLTVALDSSLVTGDSVRLTIFFYLKIPQLISRLGYCGNHYEIVQWYPKPCVFDQQGWHRNGYHALGEFYGEFGRYDVEIELPADFVVAATGERTSPEDNAFIDSLIISQKKIYLSGNKKIRFHADRVHDFAWVCDPDFIVGRKNLEGINIYSFCRKKNKTKWQNAGEYAFDAVDRYNRWYGQYPYMDLSVVDGYFSGGMEYPNLVIVGSGEDPLSRNFESIIIHEIGHQWFYGMLGSNEMDEAWLDEGFATYTEIRYFEDKYGKENSLLKSNLIPPLTKRYFHRVAYYLAYTNKIEKPVLTPAYEFIDTPLGYFSAAYSKPALFLLNLEGYLGKDVFSLILKEYFERFRFKHPSSDDFIDVCEELSGKPMKEIFYAFLNSSGNADWQIMRKNKKEVQISHSGDLLIPVEIYIETDMGGRIYRQDTPSMTYIFPEAKKIKRVIIDPYGYSLESNYHNNYSPTKVEFKPLLSWPSLDAYQVFFVPYLWYDADDGVTPGIYLAGSEFIDFDFVKGRHQWILGYIYGMKSGKHYYNFSYQTPIFFKKGQRMRFAFKGSNSNSEDKYRIGFINNWSIPLTPGPQVQLENMLAYNNLLSYERTDSQYWELGKNITFENAFRFKYRDWKVVAGLSVANKNWMSTWTYLKTTVAVAKRINFVLPVHFRIFAGRIFGTPPNQEEIFLCGALRHKFISDLFFSQEGYFSPQEHVHIEGDGMMPGYQTLHISSGELYSLNLDCPSTSFVRLFTDFGCYRDSLGDPQTAFDIGVKIVLGPVSFNFPLYTKTTQPWEFRWSIGF